MAVESVGKTCASFSENMYVFPGKDVHVFCVFYSSIR